MENSRVNTSLIRRRLADENLWIESKTIGLRTKTKISIAYLNDIVDKSLLDELYSRLDRINTDSILEDGDVEELIQDAFYTPFPTVYTTERPDTAVAHLLEGKIAIIVDGSPMVIVIPALFVQFFHNTETIRSVQILAHLFVFLDLFLFLLPYLRLLCTSL